MHIQANLKMDIKHPITDQILLFFGDVFIPLDVITILNHTGIFFHAKLGVEGGKIITSSE